MHVVSPCSGVRVRASSLALLALQTNNSTKTRAVNALKLAEHGITASAEEVVSSAYVTARYMADSGLVAGDKVYVIGEVRPSCCPPPFTITHVRRAVAVAVVIRTSCWLKTAIGSRSLRSLVTGFQLC